MGAGSVGRARGVNDGEMALVPKRLERRQRGMQSEEAVEIDHLLPRNVDAGPHGVIRGLGVGHNNVQAVSSAALENDDEPFVAGTGLRRAPCRPRKERGDGSGTDYGHRAALQECPSCDAHALLSYLRWNSGEPSNSPAITFTLAGWEGNSNWVIA